MELLQIVWYYIQTIILPLTNLGAVILFIAVVITGLVFFYRWLAKFPQPEPVGVYTGHRQIDVPHVLLVIFLGVGILWLLEPVFNRVV